MRYSRGVAAIAAAQQGSQAEEIGQESQWVLARLLRAL